MRLLIRLIGVVLSLAVLALAALFVIPTDRLANLAAQQLEGVTGRSVVFAGDVRPTIYPSIGVRTGPVSLSNAPWSEAGPMFRAEALDVALDLGAALRGEVVIRRISAQDPVIVLERAQDGRANWDFTAAADPTDTQAPEAGGTGGLRPFSIDEAVITNAAVRFIDRQGGQDLGLAGLDLTFSLPDFEGPAELALSGDLNGQRVALEARVAQFAAALAGQVADLKLKAEAGAARARFDGRAGTAPLAAEGRMEADLGDLRAVFAALGLDAPAIPAPMADGLGGSAQVTFAPEGSLHLRDLTLRAGPNRVTGAADLRPGEARPRLVADLSAGTLDLTGLGGPGAGAAGSDGVAPGWPTQTIDASALGLVDAEVTLAADRLSLDGLTLAPLRLGLTVDRSRAVFDLRQIGLYDGRISGEFVINARSGLSTGGDLRAEGIGLLPLLRDTAGFERLAGSGTASVRFLAVGASIDAMMRSLSGEGRIDLGQGEIIGFDLAGMLRNLDMGYMGEGNRTIYRSISGSFTIADGVLRNDDLQMQASRVTASGRGTVDIGRRMLDYRVVPVALVDGAGEGGLRVPLLIRGPWDVPSFSLDLEGLAQERLREERERLEERARAEAREAEARARERAEQELSDRLRLERQEGERLEDAARRRLEQEAGDRLRRLLRD